MSSRGGRGGGRGSKRSSKGGRRHFTNPDQIQAEMDKEEKKKAWRKQQGIESESSGDEEDDDAKPTEPEPAAKSKPKKEHGAPGELPPSSSEEDSEEESSDEPDKPKGVSHLIDIENPNRVKQGPKKVAAVAVDGTADTTQLSRREREEIEKQEAHARYMKKHLAGETTEAQADLARLAIIRAKREEAAAKKAAAAEAAATAATGDKKT